ncbi:MAG: hypothetical protein Q8P15_00475 [Nanoarchaeota archaeon]|nr:hypothetical protein [Nanoarchaeota archaeon]
MEYAYISTDSNEVKQIFERRRLDERDLVKGYELTEDLITVDNTILPIINLPVNIGKEIKNNYNLIFNPMSAVFLAEVLPKRTKKCLMKKLKEQGLMITLISQDGVN